MNIYTAQSAVLPFLNHRTSYRIEYCTNEYKSYLILIKKNHLTKLCIFFTRANVQLFNKPTQCDVSFYDTHTRVHIRLGKHICTNACIFTHKRVMSISIDFLKFLFGILFSSAITTVLILEIPSKEFLSLELLI